jgi:hypothetical protein
VTVMGVSPFCTGISSSNRGATRRPREIKAAAHAVVHRCRQTGASCEFALPAARVRCGNC